MAQSETLGETWRAAEPPRDRPVVRSPNGTSVGLRDTPVRIEIECVREREGARESERERRRARVKEREIVREREREREKLRESERENATYVGLRYAPSRLLTLSLSKSLTLSQPRPNFDLDGRVCPDVSRERM